MRRRALVIGGSLGGLFAANLLRQAGWDVLVLERVADDLAGRGAGLGTHDELFAVMRRLGIAIDPTIGVPAASRICLDRTGAVNCAAPWGHVMTAWARLYRPLKDALPRKCYRAGATLARLEADADGVTAVCADGTRERGDLLVGADGIHSTVRAQLLPAVVPRYAGYTIWRGVVAERDIPPEIHAALFGDYVFCLPPGEMMLGYAVPGPDDDIRPGRRAFNWVWYRPVEEHEALPALLTDATGHRHGLGIPPPLIRPELIAAMRAEARALLAPQIADILERTARPFLQPIFDLASPRLALGRAVLLGDAAFVARPHVGAGVTKAALDAVCLADALRDHGDDIDAALTRYDRERRRFGEAIVARARWLGAYIEARARPGATRPGLPEEPAAVLREIGAKLNDIPELAGIAA